MVKSLFESKNHGSISELAKAWKAHNEEGVLFELRLLGLVVSILLIPFDYLFFGDSSSKYIMFRLGSIVLFGLPILFARPLGSVTRYKKFLPTYTVSVLMFYNGAYPVFLANAPQAHVPFIVAAIYMNVFATNLVLHRLWTLHAWAGAVFLAVFGVGSVLSEATMVESQNFLLWTVIIGMYFWFQRRMFFSNLYHQFQHLLFQYPKRVAQSIILLGSKNKYLDEFKPRLRPCVCICLDWRSFQKVATSYEPIMTTQLLEISHQILLQIVSEAVPKESFHADWTADEFFVTIYSEDDCPVELAKYAGAFMQRFYASYASEATAKMGVHTPDVDVGIAAGQCIVGLVGPKNMQKLTALGDVGGRAKRNQSEAKDIRGQLQAKERLHVTVIDASLRERLSEMEEFKTLPLTPITAGTKDIAGQTVYYTLGSKAQLNRAAA